MNVRHVAVTSALLFATACGKSEPKPKVDFLAGAPKVEYDIKVEPVESVASPAAVADTWAARVKDQVRQARDDLQKCRNEFLIPFQFDKMRRRNMEFVNITDMDAVCIDGIEGDATVRKRGPFKVIRGMNDEIGKNAQLDRFLTLAMDQLEHFKVFSFMTKKVGAPNIAQITDTAKAARDRVLDVGGQIDKLAADIEKWPDGQKPDDDPTVIGQSIELPALKQQLVQNYGWFMGDLVGAYDRYAAKSWEAPNLPKLGTLHMWVQIPQKRLQQDRARLGHVTGADEKQLAEIKAYFDAVDNACKAVIAGLPRYEKYHEELPEKDPNHRAVEQAQAAVLKIHKAWGLTADAAHP